MKTIPYTKKTTNAKTEYRAVDKKLMAVLLYDLNHLNRLLKAMSRSTESDISSTYTIFNTSNKQLPRMGQPPYRYNTPVSFIEGVLYNFSQGTQRDLSAKTCQGLEEVFKLAHEHLNGFEEIEFVDANKRFVDLNPHKNNGHTFLTFFGE